jgi:hypothetical protein
VDYCGCLGQACASFAGYPHADEAACLAACEGLSEPELTCWSAYCDQALDDPSEHVCEHAWGELGLDEC